MDNVGSKIAGKIKEASPNLGTLPQVNVNFKKKYIDQIIDPMTATGFSQSAVPAAPTKLARSQWKEVIDINKAISAYLGNISKSL